MFQMDCLPQECHHFGRPVAVRHCLAQVDEIPQQMCKAYLMTQYPHIEILRVSVGHRYALGQSFGKMLVYDCFSTAFVDSFLYERDSLESPCPLLLPINPHSGLNRTGNLCLTFSVADCIYLSGRFFANPLKYVRNLTLTHLKTEDVIENINYTL